MDPRAAANTEVIAVDQDPDGVQGERIAGWDLQEPSDSVGLGASPEACAAGALAAGGNIRTANLTVAHAVAWCDANVACAGFTTHAPAACAAANSSAVFQMYFKDASVSRNSDANWTAWQRPGATTNVWARPLTGGRWAFVFLNVGKTAVDVTCDTRCMGRTSLAGKAVTVRDLWAHRDLGERTVHTLVAKALAPEGGHAMYLLTPLPEREW